MGAIVFTGNAETEKRLLKDRISKDELYQGLSASNSYYWWIIGPLAVSTKQGRAKIRSRIQRAVEDKDTGGLRDFTQALRRFAAEHVSNDPNVCERVLGVVSDLLPLSM
jgi:hypothetical protein